MSDLLKIYLAIGAICFAGVLVAMAIEARPWTVREAFGNVRDELIPPDRSAFDVFRNLLAHGIAAALAVIAWPAMGVLLAWHLWREGQLVSRSEFRVRPCDLLAATTVEAIECAERPLDPLHGVPDLPFGFLNPRWREFVATIKPGWTVWAFSTGFDEGWGGRVTVSGYAAVSGRKVRTYFIARRRVEETPEAE